MELEDSTCIRLSEDVCCGSVTRCEWTTNACNGLQWRRETAGVHQEFGITVFSVRYRREARNRAIRNQLDEEEDRQH